MKEGQVGWREWGLLALLMSAMMFSIVDRFALAVLLEPIKQDLDLSDRQLGLLNGIAFGLFYATMGVPLGWLADRWSRKGTIIGGIAIWSTATALCGVASNYAQLLAARIFVGAGEAGLAPASYSILHDRFPKERLGTAVSLLQIGSMLGSGLSIMLVGFIFTMMATHGSSLPWMGGLRPWQATFIVVALPGIVFILMFALMNEHRPATADARKAATLVSAFAAKPGIYASLIAGMSGIVIALYALFSWMPAILTREFGWSTAQVGGTYGTIVLIFSPAGALFGGWLCDRLVSREAGSPHARIALGAAAVALPAFMVIAFTRSPQILLIAVALAHFAIAVPNGLGPALTQLLAPAGARTQISALYVMVVNLMGIGLGPVLIGTLSEQFPTRSSGLRHSMCLTAIAGLVVSLMLLRILARLTGDRQFHALPDRATAETP